MTRNNSIIEELTGLQRVTENFEERSGSVVECLTQDRGVAGLSLIEGAAMYPSARHYLLLSTGSIQEVPSQHDIKLLTGM